jgi:hypothetical protein
MSMTKHYLESLPASEQDAILGGIGNAYISPDEPTDEELAEWALALVEEDETAFKRKIEKSYADAFRLYQIAVREQAHLEGNAEYVSNGFREAARRLLAVAASQRSEIKRLNREIGRLEREAAPLIKPQPKGVKEGCFDV